ncbi:meiotically up-regulated gene 113-domain-containing protein [Camillea tinctor]|nr:meiotically up-regulated gene 113-domain-containing protein [Camillea tinctor]
MPFIPNTPESAMARADSKNPGTTCRGITSNGRPCRRPLIADGSPVPAKIAKKQAQKLRVDDPSDPDQYCWQHKDQASLSAKSSPGPRTTPILENRESLDVLVDKLGIAEAEKRRRKPARYSEKPGNADVQQQYQQPQRPARKEWTFCCCFRIAEEPAEEQEPPMRPQPKPVQSAPAAPIRPGSSARPGSSSARPSTSRPGSSARPSTSRPSSSRVPGSQHLTPGSSNGPRPSLAASKKSSAQSGTSQTSQYLSLIPASASPQTASQLMAELAKPISQQDEAGYIYIFWLTPEDHPSTPAAEAARSLLTPPSRPEARQRRPSDVLESFAKKSSKAGASKKTILLKIGRASNVQRRLNEWTRQCGYNLSLIRYYPHIPTNDPSTPRKMPHSHKVERLVHIELAGAGLRVSDKAPCEACGKSHREWFEVDATRESIAMVDEVVKRWSDWDETRG